MKKSFKILSILLVLLLLSLHTTAVAKVEAIIGPQPLSSNLNLPMQLPTTDESEIIISRSQYVISYNKFRRSPNWVSWNLDPSNFGSSGRSKTFTQDKDLVKYFKYFEPSFHAVTSAEYKGSCFDRGHQAPSADRTDSTEDNGSTFVMSNMVPQASYLNRVVWMHLEKYTRELVGKGKKIFVMAGPIYDQDFGAIGPHHDIPVPSKNFKIIVVSRHDEGLPPDVIAVAVPNTMEDGTVPTPEHCPALTVTAPSNRMDWMKYQTDVKNIERLTGLTISLPDAAF